MLFGKSGEGYNVGNDKPEISITDLLNLVNEILPNVMRQSTNKRFGGMSSSRKVGDVKLHAKLADQFKFEQFDEIEKDLNGLIDEIRSIDEQLDILFKNGKDLRKMNLINRISELNTVLNTVKSKKLIEKSYTKLKGILNYILQV